MENRNNSTETKLIKLVLSILFYVVSMKDVVGCRTWLGALPSH